MKRSAILISCAVAIAVVISAIAVYTHYRLLATEGVEHGNETAQQIASEVLTGQPANSNQTKTNSSSLSHSESEETAAQRAAEGK